MRVASPSEEFIQRNRTHATAEGLAQAADHLTVATSAARAAQQATADAVAAHDRSLARAGAIQARMTEIDGNLKTLRSQLTNEATLAVDLANGSWSPSCTQAMAKLTTKRNALVAEREVLFDVLGTLVERFIVDAPALHRVLIADGEAVLEWLRADADLKVRELLIAGPGPDLSTVADAHVLKISEQIVRVDEGRAVLRAAEEKAEEFNHATTH